MKNPKSNTLPGILPMYFIVLAVYCLDVFLFKSDLSVSGDAFYSSLLGVIILFLYIQASKAKLNIIGISKSVHKMTAGLVSGAIFSLIPFLTVLLAECFYHGAASLKFLPPSLMYVRADGNLPPVVIVLIYVFSSFTASAFKELFFRGLLLKQLKKATSFFKANVIQALMYTFFILSIIIRNAVSGYAQSKDIKLILLTAFACIACEFAAALKWGLLTRVSGAVYAAMADHFIFTFVTSSIFVYDSEASLYAALRAAAIQFISFAAAVVYYSLTMKKIKTEKLEKQRIKELAHKQKEEKKALEKISLDSKLEGVAQISPSDFKSISGTKKLSDDEILQGEKRLESALKASSSGKDERLTDKEIDSLLRDLSGSLATRHRSKGESTQITEDFDTDEFLKNYKKHGNTHKHGGHSHGAHRPSGGQSGRSHTRSTTPAKEKSTPKKQPEKTLWQIVKSSGAVDTSSSNDLL